MKTQKPPQRYAGKWLVAVPINLEELGRTGYSKEVKQLIVWIAEHAKKDSKIALPAIRSGGFATRTQVIWNYLRQELEKARLHVIPIGSSHGNKMLTTYECMLDPAKAIEILNASAAQGHLGEDMRKSLDRAIRRLDNPQQAYSNQQLLAFMSYIETILEPKHMLKQIKKFEPDIVIVEPFQAIQIAQGLPAYRTTWIGKKPNILTRWQERRLTRDLIRERKRAKQARLKRRTSIPRGK
jgi:hypothetical protein